MKIYMTENEGCFTFDMTAETMAAVRSVGAVLQQCDE